MTIIEALEASTVVTTVLQFLSGSLVCKNYIQKKSTGETSGIPFLCGFLSCSMWFNYGSLINQSSIQLVNIIGATLFFFYTMIYFVFCTSKRQYVHQFGVTILTLAGTTLYAYGLEEHSDQVHIMGLVACVFSVCFFAAPLTKLFHVVRVKNSESLPLPLIATSFLVSLQWLIYGILISDTFIQVPNFLGCVLCIIQLCLFVIYPPKTYTGQGYRLVDQSALQFS